MCQPEKNSLDVLARSDQADGRCYRNIMSTTFNPFSGQIYSRPPQNWLALLMSFNWKYLISSNTTDNLYTWNYDGVFSLLTSDRCPF